jgi:hypothetical protein
VTTRPGLFERIISKAAFLAALFYNRDGIVTRVAEGFN